MFYQENEWNEHKGEDERIQLGMLGGSMERESGMITRADVLHHKALKFLSETEIDRMKHCIGYRPEKVYHRNGAAYYKPYRNYYDPGGKDIEIWQGLKEKGFAESGKLDDDGHGFYWLNMRGLNILSAALEVFVYSDASTGNEIDAAPNVIETLLDDAVYCGYGCWLPTSAKDIAIRVRLPYKMTLETLRYLAEKCGYVRKECYGGIDDEGFPHCTNGWVLTKKWIDENQERYKERQQEEYARMDAIGKPGCRKKEWYE